MTDVADYAKTLWARAATLHCPGCGGKVERDSPASAAEQTLRHAMGERVVVTYPLRVTDLSDFVGVRESLMEQGYTRLRLNDDLCDLSTVRPSDLTTKVSSSNGKTREIGAGFATLEVVADRTVAKLEERSRLVEALEAAMERGEGQARVWIPKGPTY